jgi:alpha-mannosidase
MSHPYILRLVEFNGHDCEVELSIAGTVASACRANLLGSVTEQLPPRTEPERSIVSLHMRPHEIATIYLDIVEGRKQTRDLDAARNVWATVHRVEE